MSSVVIKECTLFPCRRGNLREIPRCEAQFVISDQLLLDIVIVIRFFHREYTIPNGKRLLFINMIIYMRQTDQGEGQTGSQTQTDRETGGQTGRHTERYRQADRHRQTERRADRQADIQTERYRQADRH